MSRDLIQYLSKKVQDEITIISDDLARGTAKDHGEYKYACGIIRGLMIANGIFIDTSQRLEHEDDD
jgi:hypothetical protein